MTARMRAREPHGSLGPVSGRLCGRHPAARPVRTGPGGPAGRRAQTRLAARGSGHGGNILGSAVNWLLGRCCVRFQDKRWFPVKKEKLNKARTWYRTYGRWSLLLSWAPVIGDPLTLVAGLLREPFASFILIVGLAKLARYLVVAALVLPWTA